MRRRHSQAFGSSDTNLPVLLPQAFPIVPGARPPREGETLDDYCNDPEVENAIRLNQQTIKAERRAQIAKLRAETNAAADRLLRGVSSPTPNENADDTNTIMAPTCPPTPVGKDDLSVAGIPVTPPISPIPLSRGLARGPVGESVDSGPIESAATPTKCDNETVNSMLKDLIDFNNSTSPASAPSRTTSPTLTAPAPSRATSRTRPPLPKGPRVLIEGAFFCMADPKHKITAALLAEPGYVKGKEPQAIKGREQPIVGDLRTPRPEGETRAQIPSRTDEEAKARRKEILARQKAAEAMQLATKAIIAAEGGEPETATPRSAIRI